MSQRIVTPVVAIIVFMFGALVLNSCAASALPPAPAESHQEEVPWSWVEPSISILQKQVSVLEWPTEARIGENITVKIKIGTDEFWAWLVQQIRERQPQDPFWAELDYYSLYLSPGRGHAPIAVIGGAKLDENWEVWWYGPVPDKVLDGRPVEPGVWHLTVEIGEPSFGPSKILVERNIMVKD